MKIFERRVDAGKEGIYFCGIKVFACNKNKKFNSQEYWENRYAKNGNSGEGSYGRLAEFKAEILNDFYNKENIDSVIEFGVGDGNNLALYNFNNYIGFDVSDTILNVVKNKFRNDETKTFLRISDFKTQKADLSLSLDVIYHLIEDDIFNVYMNNLFNSSNKYVIIYSSNFDEYRCMHVTHRKFSTWIEENKKEWRLFEFIPNKYKFIEGKKETSFSDFYIYKKQRGDD